MSRKVLLTYLAISMVLVTACLETPRPGHEAAKGSPNQRESRLIRRATIVSLDRSLGRGDLGVVLDADIRFDDRIIEVGKRLERGDSIVIDGHGKVVLPGFVDTHNHLWQTAIRGCGASERLERWLKRCVYRGFVMTEDQVHAAVRLATLDLIATGVTTVVDWSHAFTPWFSTGNLRALADSRIRFVFGHLVFARPFSIDFGMGDLRSKKERFIDRNPLASLHVAAIPTLQSRRTLRALAEAATLAREMTVPLNVHLLESDQSARDDPMQALERAAAFEGSVFANHVVHASESQIEYLASRRVSVSYNPQSNQRLAAGVMPVGVFAKHGTRLGLGLDGGANDTSDFFATMRSGVGLQRALSMDAKRYPSVEEAIRMATLGGAEALGMEGMIGSLAPGKSADLIIVDTTAPNFATAGDAHVVERIVLNGQPSNVEAVFVGGVPVKRKGRLVIGGRSVDDVMTRALAVLAETDLDKAFGAHPDSAAWVRALDEAHGFLPEFPTQESE